MSEPGTVEVGLFAAAGILGLPGCLLLVGWYGFPASPAVGIAFLILSSMCLGIFFALTDEELTA